MAAKGRILEGVKVLDLTRFYSGPQATLFLAALGADVVRIDDPARGDPTADAPPYFGPGGISMNRQSPHDLGIAYLKRMRGKKSLEIDLKDEAGRALFFRLLPKADVLVENFRVGVMERLGIGYETLRAHNPGLIHCSITGYGATGPERDRKAYDTMIQASTGLMSVTGEPDGGPQKTGSALSDGIAGTFAVTGILGALFHRERTGEGQFIDVSMADCLVSLLMDEPWDCYDALGMKPRQGNRIMRFSPFNRYEAKDGMVVIGAATHADWENILSLIGRDDLKADADYMNTSWRIANNDRIDALVEGWTRERTAEDVIAACAPAGIPCSPVRDARDLADWEQLRHRGVVTRAAHPGMANGDGVAAAAFPLKFSAADTRYETPAPLPGQHNEAVLRDWLGDDEPGERAGKGQIQEKGD